MRLSLGGWAKGLIQKAVLLDTVRIVRKFLSLRPLPPVAWMDPVPDAEFSYYRSTSQPCVVPRILHGRARVRQRANFVKFSCLGRYTLVGNKYATCRNGQWDVPIPVCVKSGCPQLEEVKNAVNMTSHNNSWVVFFCLPGHQLVGSPVVYCDGRQWNSTAPGCVDGSAKHSTECDFEKPDLCGWTSDELHDFDWRRWNKKTPSSFLQTGPAHDHTYGKNGTGFYMYIESTGRIENNTARLISPVYDADLARNGCFVFYYHMFGRSMGGLRVYQKPDRLSMSQMLSSAQGENYTLFEQWGDQGNEWYGSVSMLSNVSDNFQIVIEGIRGESFMSDIAIDDVSIQHGENCTKAMNEATTPSTVLMESCVGRCDLYAEETAQRGCSCSIVCVITENCCPDFLDVCEFLGNDNRSSDDETSSASSTSVALPQTQKLVATTTETLPPTTSTSTTTSTTSTTTTTTTRRPTTSTTTSTTTRRPTTRYIRPTTTLRTTFTTTTKSPITSTTSTTPRVTTSLRTTPRPTTKFIEPITKSKSTTLTFRVTPISSTTLLIVQTTKQESQIDHNTEKVLNDKFVNKKTGGMSGATVAITVLLVIAACCGALWAAFVLKRTNRGVAALARLRGRTASDPEVRYLKADVDDE